MLNWFLKNGTEAGRGKVAFVSSGEDVNLAIIHSVPIATIYKDGQRVGVTVMAVGFSLKTVYLKFVSAPVH